MSRQPECVCGHDALLHYADEIDGVLVCHSPCCGCDYYLAATSQPEPANQSDPMPTNPSPIAPEPSRPAPTTFAEWIAGERQRFALSFDYEQGAEDGWDARGQVDAAEMAAMGAEIAARDNVLTQLCAAFADSEAIDGALAVRMRQIVREWYERHADGCQAAPEGGA